MASASALVSQASDAELIARLRARDPGAIAELHDRHARLVYSIALRFAKGDVRMAEETLHEVLMQLWDNPDSYEARVRSISAEPFQECDLKWWLIYTTRDFAIFRRYGHDPRSCSSSARLTSNPPWLPHTPDWPIATTGPRSGATSQRMRHSEATAGAKRSWVTLTVCPTWSMPQL